MVLMYVNYANELVLQKGLRTIFIGAVHTIHDDLRPVRPVVSRNNEQVVGA